MARSDRRRSATIHSFTHRHPARILGAFGIVIGITIFYFYLFNQANSTTIALTYLLSILGIAARWGLLEAILASLAGAVCFNFFFLPPLFTLYLSDAQNWVALAAFLTTAFVASHLSTSAKARAFEAMRRREEVERLYELSRALMATDTVSAGDMLARRIAQVFATDGAAVFDPESDRVFRAGVTDNVVSDNALRNCAETGAVFCDTEANLSILPLTIGNGMAGSLAISGSSISDSAAHAIANLAAIVMERARAAATASRMEAARQNEAMKSMMLDALAHEFRTPLTSIKIAASSILDESGSAQIELRAVIEEEVDRLDSLVTETIRMAQIEAGELQLQMQQRPVDQIIALALKQLSILVADIEIRTTLPRDLPEVYADPELISLTIRQLVTNALKYSSSEAPIEIRVRAEGGFVVISVKDSGPGIPLRERSRIFERYYRLGDSAGRVPGTGLGLHIAQNIVQAHGGRIWVESEPDHGSEFLFTLPVAGEALKQEER